MRKRSTKWHPARANVARWPKSSKGAGGKKLAGRICGRILAEFCQKWQKRGRRELSKEVPNFSVMTNSQRQTKCNILIFN
jgi:hypothetical protein